MEFACKNIGCESQYTQIEVLDSIDPLGQESGFLCKKCLRPLIYLGDDEGPELDSDDTPAKFNKQFKPILDLMQQIDTVTIPHIEGKDAIEGAVELPRDKETNPGAKHEVVQETAVRPTAVKGTNTVVEKIEVQIASSSEYNEAARAAEKARQEKIAAQNQLPTWHVKSTVDKSQESKSAKPTTVLNGADTPTIKAEMVDVKPDPAGNLDDVFAQLAAERAKQEEEDDDEEEEEEDDEDEFEDAMVPAPDAKRVKLESSAAPTPTNATTPAISTGDGGDESDEDEFEDVN
jgi:transcription initiation factor TFIIE subunit alpha